jgi:EAL and modified HD-GYP domain-containing signal transduction protein
MNDHPVLSQIALGYSPMIDRHRAVTAVRLAVFPLRPDRPPHAAELLAAVAEVWPPEGGRVSLNIVSETLLQELMGAEPPTNLMVEVPAFMACDPVHSAALQALYKRGNTLLIKGRPLAPLPREVLPCFAYSIVDVADERRDGQPAPGGVTRTIPHVQSGVTTLDSMEAAFSRGAIAVLGWPMEGVLGQGRRAGEPQLQQIVELINRVDRGESLDRLEEVLRADPTLAYRLIKTMNSPAFGLPVEVSSFRHAIMLLGHQRLKRWLALLLASASKDANMKPVMYSALRRGLLMEELARGGGDADRSAEMFICGVFSLLDKMMGEPFDKLLASIPVPPAVRAALVDESGPHRPYLDLVMAIEASSVYDIRAAADSMLLGVSEVNRAVLRALSAARQID